MSVGGDDPEAPGHRARPSPDDTPDAPDVPDASGASRDARARSPRPGPRPGSPGPLDPDGPGHTDHADGPRDADRPEGHDRPEGSGDAEGSDGPGPRDDDTAPDPARPDGPPPSDGPDESGAQFHGSLLETLRVAVVLLDTTGRVLLWSPLAEEVLGWSGDTIVGHRVGGLFGPAEAAEGPPDGPRRLRPVPQPGQAEAILGELLRAGRWDGVLSLRHSEGHTVQVEVRASLLMDGDRRPFVLASLVETSRLRTLEHDLAALDSLFASSPLGVAIFDSDLRFVRINEALARMNGLPIAAHLGRTVAEILDPVVAVQLTELQRNVLVSGRPVIDLVVPSPSGHGHRSLSYHRLEDRAGRVLGMSAMVMDVTERVQTAARAERARRRLALLDDAGSRISGVLDVRRVAEALTEAVVPDFGDYCGVILHSEVRAGGELPEVQYRESTPLYQMAVRAIRWNPAVARFLDHRLPVSYNASSIFGTVLRTGQPRMLATQEELRTATFPGDPKIEALFEADVHSMLVLPLRARGVVLGLLVTSRAGPREPFDAEDLTLAGELADRAGAALDNARLYAREREGALTLQRSLLPRTLPAPPGVEVASRYVPGSSGAEAGGDWFDVIPLAGGRLAFVVGDVMGHGLGAAATMGRLRTAVRALSGLDMAPDELLRRVDELGDDLAPSQAEGWMATMVYCVYDPATRRCAVAQAGHLPPVLAGEQIEPGRCEAQLLELPTGVPLGVGGVPFETSELEMPDGAVLVLYTDGLVEARGKDISVGMERLRRTLCRSVVSLEDACDELLAGRDAAREPDDVALLMVRLGGMPAGSTGDWTFPAAASAVRLARRRVAETLAEWDLAELEDIATLLVSELVTNSLRYAHGPIGVRMVRGASLLVEVSDPLPDPPRERVADEEDEGGRGLQLVATASRRWGTRHGAVGKTVWFELELP